MRQCVTRGDFFRLDVESLRAWECGAMSKRWLLIAGAVAFVVLLVILVTIYSGGGGGGGTGGY